MGLEERILEIVKSGEIEHESVEAIMSAKTREYILEPTGEECSLYPECKGCAKGELEPIAYCWKLYRLRVVPVQPKLIGYAHHFIVVLPAEKTKELLKLYAEYCRELLPWETPVHIIGKGVFIAHKLLEKVEEIIIEERYRIYIEFMSKPREQRLHSPHIHYIAPYHWP